MYLLLSLLILADVADATSRNETPSHKELKSESDVVAILRIESVERWTMYSEQAILIGTSWYIVRCHVVSVVGGKIPSESKTVEVIFRADEEAAVFGYARDPLRTKFANSESLVQPSPANGNDESQAVEVLAYLKDAKHFTRQGGPPMFMPTTGLDHGEASFRVLQVTKFRIQFKRARQAADTLKGENDDN